MVRKRKPRVAFVDGIPVTPIPASKRKKLNRAAKNHYGRLRKRYPELHGKIVDFVTHSIEDGTLYVGIRFKEKTDFSLRYACGMFVVGADLCDISTGDYETIREYMKPVPT